MKGFKLVNTDNFAGDYPDERELLTADEKGKLQPLTLDEDKAKRVQEALNYGAHDLDSRYWVVKPADYKLQGAFEP